MKVWLNGDILAVEDARIDPTDRGLLLGDGLFETMAVRGMSVRRLDRHLARLAIGAKVLNLPLRWEREVLERAIQGCVDANGVVEGAVRLTLTRGPGPRGARPFSDIVPTLLISAVETAAETAPMRAISATRTRRNEFSPLSRIKATNYGDAVVALLEARDAGADEALLLNTRGKYAEACTSNLFLVVDGRVQTPRVADGALPGTLRGALLDAGLAVESTLGIDEMQRATEAFLTNAQGLRALISLDGRPIGAGGPGPETERLAAVVDQLP